MIWNISQYPWSRTGVSGFPLAGSIRRYITHIGICINISLYIIIYQYIRSCVKKHSQHHNGVRLEVEMVAIQPGTCRTCHSRKWSEASFNAVSLPTHGTLEAGFRIYITGTTAGHHAPMSPAPAAATVFQPSWNTTMTSQPSGLPTYLQRRSGVLNKSANTTT